MWCRFTGADGSLGYRAGETYRLEVRTVDLNGRVPQIVRPYVCPYGSWDAFWRNWQWMGSEDGRAAGRREGDLADAGPGGDLLRGLGDRPGHGDMVEGTT
jgi:hypothetical protein